MFKEGDKRNVVSAAWVVRPREGERPYLYYGEIKEAMNAVHKAQQAIPDGNAELAALRTLHDDGVKACFLENDGALLIEGYPTGAACPPRAEPSLRTGRYNLRRTDLPA